MAINSRVAIREIREFPYAGLYFLQRILWQYHRLNMCVGGIRTKTFENRKKKKNIMAESLGNVGK